MTDLSNLKANIEGMTGVEVQEFCGISWTDSLRPDIVFTDGNAAVGEITVPTEFGPITIPVCEKCLEIVSQDFDLSSGEL